MICSYDCLKIGECFWTCTKDKVNQTSVTDKSIAKNLRVGLGG